MKKYIDIFYGCKTIILWPLLFIIACFHTSGSLTTIIINKNKKIWIFFKHFLKISLFSEKQWISDHHKSLRLTSYAFGKLGLDFIQWLWFQRKAKIVSVINYFWSVPVVGFSKFFPSNCLWLFHIIAILRYIFTKPQF